MLVNQLTRDMASVNYLVRAPGTHITTATKHSLTRTYTHTFSTPFFSFFQEVCAALNAVCRLTTEDTIPAVLPEVLTKLKHEASTKPLSLCMYASSMLQVCVRAFI